MGCAFLYVKEWEGKKREEKKREEYLSLSQLRCHSSSEGAKERGDRRRYRSLRHGQTVLPPSSEGAKERCVLPFLSS